MASSPAPPPTPDYTGAAQAQGQANIDTARLQGRMNNPNIVGPLGGQTVTWDGDTPTITQNLTTAAQDALNNQQQVQSKLSALGLQGIGTASDVLGKPFDPQLAGLQTSVGDAGGVQNNVAAGMYGLQQGGPAAGEFGMQQGGPAAGAYGLQQGGVRGPNLQNQLDTSGVAKAAVNAGTTGQDAIMSRLAPEIDRQKKATAQTLANQGLVPGGEAYTNAMRDQSNQQNDLLTQAALQGINLDQSANQQGFNQALASGQFGNQSQMSGFDARLQNQNAANAAAAGNFGQAQSATAMQNAASAGNFAQAQQAAGMQNQAGSNNFNQALMAQQAGNQSQQQLYNQMLQSAQFGNTAQQQSLAQQLQLRNQPLNEITGLMSGSQIQMPQFQGYNGSNIAPAPVFAGAQAQGNAAMDQYGIQSANANAFNSGLFGLAGAGAGAIGRSDIRLKSNIVRVGDHPLGVGIYEYDIEGRRELGVMAQEVFHVKPDAVHVDTDGYLMVDYAALQA